MKYKKYIGRVLSTDEYATAYNKIQKDIKELEDIRLECWKDYLLLKWKGLKWYDYSTNEEAKKLIKELYDIWISSSAITQKNTERQKEILCNLIDITDWYIQNDWEWNYYTKEEAKEYILNEI